MLRAKQYLVFIRFLKDKIKVFNLEELQCLHTIYINMILCLNLSCVKAVFKPKCLLFYHLLDNDDDNDKSFCNKRLAQTQ